MKRLLVIGGAVMVLAACDNSSTAPTLSRHNGLAASVKKLDSTPSETSTSNTGGITLIEECGYWYKDGGPDSTYVPCSW
jgi:hypothetical protein